MLLELARLAADSEFPCTCGDAYVAATASHREECTVLRGIHFDKVWAACLTAAEAAIKECAKIVEAREPYWNVDHQELRRRLAKEIRALTNPRDGGKE